MRVRNDNERCPIEPERPEHNRMVVCDQRIDRFRYGRLRVVYHLLELRDGERLRVIPGEKGEHIVCRLTAEQP